MESVTKFRATLVMLIMALVLGFFAFKLYDLQIIETGGGSKNNQATFTTLTRVKAARGDILDRNGNLLVSNRASYDLNINHYVLLTANGTNENLLRLVKRCEETGIEYTEHFPVSQERPFTDTRQQQNAIWQGHFQTFLNYMEIDSDITAPLLVEKLRERYKLPAEWTDDEARKVIGLLYEMTLRKCVGSLSTYVFLADASDEELSAIVELNIPGMKVEASTVREYNTKYAAHILGYVGAMNAEQWEYYKDLPGYEMDAEVGQDGLEKAYEEYLHGIDGWREDTVTTDGTLVSSVYRQEPKAGSNVEVSIDLNLQMAGEDQMAAVIEALRLPDEKGNYKDGHDAEGGAFVAMDVKTGQILACGSYPTYDLSTFFEDYDVLAKDKLKPLYNRALLATYPPGSTYKMSMVIAAMESKLIDATTSIVDKGRFDITPTFPVFCLQWTNYGGTHGPVNAAKALQVSCNYFFYDIGSRIDLAAMDATAKGLGLGERTGVELPEYIGYRANKETKAELHSGDDAYWYWGDQILAAIGQSENRFTPIQLCSYTTALANQGNRYKATFMSRVVSSDYRTLLAENKPELLSHMDISDETYKTYCEGMYLVTQVTDTGYGTASGTFSDYPIKIAAKTGTAETGIHGTSDNGAFVCFAPLENPQIAIAVYVEKGGHGSTLASIAKQMLDIYFDVDVVGDVNSFENQIS